MPGRQELLWRLFYGLMLFSYSMFIVRAKFHYMGARDCKLSMHTQCNDRCAHTHTMYGQSESEFGSDSRVRS